MCISVIIILRLLISLYVQRVHFLYGFRSNTVCCQTYVLESSDLVFSFQWDCNVGSFSCPQSGTVLYLTLRFLDANDSFSQNLAYVQDDGVVIMKGDNTTVLNDGENRARCDA